MSDKPQLLRNLTPQEWETLIDDFQSGGQRRQRWASQLSALKLIDLALSALMKRDFHLPVKLHIVVFLEEYFAELLMSSEVKDVDDSEPVLLSKLIEALRGVLQAPVDGVSLTFSLKEQMMTSVTSILICCGECKDYLTLVESLVELLLTVVNRPNFGPDRQTRALGCECLRELERANPGLLSEIAGHLWSMCQSERTHATQSYLLLFGMVIHNVVIGKLNVSVMSTSVPLIPFNVPSWMIEEEMAVGGKKDISATGFKELRRAMAFLLEAPHILTPCGIVEFMTMIMPIALALELQFSMLKVQFVGMMYTFDPMLCHMVLLMYLRAPDSFDSQEGEVVDRLILISKAGNHYLFFRLLSLHWLLGLTGLESVKILGNKKAVLQLGPKVCPCVFDPLALKALKLDLLALCSKRLSLFNSKQNEGKGSADDGLVADHESHLVKLFENGLVSVSAFKWLPPWSSETAVAFRSFHKFMLGASSHSETDSSSATSIMESKIILHLQMMLIDLTLEFRRLVPVVLAFVNRLLGCHKHFLLGERLLQMFDKHLLPRVKVDNKLVSYFPIFDRIAEKDVVPPRGLLELFMKFIIGIIKKHGPGTGLRSWSQGSKVLSICRTLLMHHHSSRLFVRLSHLLALTCLYFPDLEVRDNARIYLRMLVCIPGKKLRFILNFGEQLTGVSPSSHFVQSPRVSHDPKKSRSISAYIHLERLVSLLVTQSWSLSLLGLSDVGGKPEHLEDAGDSSEPLVRDEECDNGSKHHLITESGEIDHPLQPLRVMDSKIAEILMTLRTHFSCIPDLRNMPGLKVNVKCIFRFQAEAFSRVWGVNSSSTELEGTDVVPALYATVLKFSSSAPYGSIPSRRIPFLLGEASNNTDLLQQQDSLAIIQVDNVVEADESFRAPVSIELEPREPTPGLVDVYIEANAENGQIIKGQLQGITIGIEDMFLKAITPRDIPEDEIPDYYSCLFNALWEACDSSTNTGRETFRLKGGKGVAAINGTRSVKLLEVPAASLIQATERHLAPYIVTVAGDPLVDIVRDRGIIKDIVWMEEPSVSPDDARALTYFDKGVLQLKYTDEEDEMDNHVSMAARNMGCIFVLIFLPPRFHLLFQMEVSHSSTLVRIRTDYWPCLAYVDDYLEALFLS
uniref:AP-5 complex subunit beta-1 n=1 Tax=Kalanchoe fedtschenkoi TaxID=63787 RepID=A0A7N0UHS1_KALFE